MSTITTDSTLGDIVTHNPDLARELERRSLDYCCGGQRTLAEACEPLGLDPQEVAEALSAVPSAPAEAWADLPPSELADHIEATHHAYLHEEMPRLAELMAKVLAVHGDRHPELAQVSKAYAELHRDMEPHLAKEERILFPAIRELERTGTVSFGPGSVAPPIAVMLREHDVAGEQLARLRELTGGYEPPEDACGSFRALYEGFAQLEADTHLHVHKENNHLFPRSVDLEAGAGGRR